MSKSKSEPAAWVARGNREAAAPSPVQTPAPVGAAAEDMQALARDLPRFYAAGPAGAVHVVRVIDAADRLAEAVGMTYPAALRALLDAVPDPAACYLAAAQGLPAKPLAAGHVWEAPSAARRQPPSTHGGGGFVNAWRAESAARRTVQVQGRPRPDARPAQAEVPTGQAGAWHLLRRLADALEGPRGPGVVNRHGSAAAALAALPVGCVAITRDNAEAALRTLRPVQTPAPATKVRRPVAERIEGLPSGAELHAEARALKESGSRSTTKALAEKYGCSQDTIARRIAGARPKPRAAAWVDGLKSA